MMVWDPLLVGHRASERVSDGVEEKGRPPFRKTFLRSDSERMTKHHHPNFFRAQLQSLSACSFDRHQPGLGVSEDQEPNSLIVRLLNLGRESAILCSELRANNTCIVSCRAHGSHSEASDCSNDDQISRSAGQFPSEASA